MRIQKKYYVFYFVLSLLFGLHTATFAQSTQNGTASWYGGKYHGRTTSSGERFNKNKLTAAHNKLPFGTMVKVTNLSNNKSVVVKINDRGPFKGRRIIDLSEAAAREIGMIHSGLSEVKIEVINNKAKEENLASATPASAANFTIQAGSFSDAHNAQRLAQRIQAIDNGLKVTLRKAKVNGRTVHQVYAGQYQDKNEANKVLRKLSREGIKGLVREEA